MKKDLFKPLLFLVSACLIMGLVISYNITSKDDHHGMVPVEKLKAQEGEGTLDTDGDGLSDLEENRKYGTNVSNPDTDGDGLPDGWEVLSGLDPRDNGTGRSQMGGNHSGHGSEPDPFPDTEMGGNGDPDADGLSNMDEYNAISIYGKRLDPLDPDTDGDGMWDGWEVDHRKEKDTGGWMMNATDPTDAEEDPDMDGLSNFKEFIIGTDPYNLDTDGDGLSDRLEAELLGLDPTSKDTDKDGLPDSWEVRYRLNASDPKDAHLDSDGDGLTNMEEYDLRFILSNWTNPSGYDVDRDGIPDGFDTDRDGIPDGWEVHNSLDPLNRSDADLDNDRDGLDMNGNGVLDPDELFTNRDEYQISAVFGKSTDPNNPDTDGDGLLDGEEVIGWKAIINSEEVTITSNPHLKDTDGDQIGDIDERGLYGTNASNEDSDGDGLTDFKEIFYTFTYRNGTYRTNATERDTDGDMLDDMEEVTPGRDGFITNATDPDSDNDDLGDGEETLFTPRPFQNGTDPTDDDTDGDGLSDGWEMKVIEDPWSISVLFSMEEWTHGGVNRTSGFWRYFGSGTWDRIGGIKALDTNITFGWLIDPTHPWDAELDPDGDSLTNADESPDGWNIDPFSADSDGDGLPDGWEVEHTNWDQNIKGWLIDPGKADSNDDGIRDGDEDPDSDGFDSDHNGFVSNEEMFTNREEYLNGTDPTDPDTDGDGLWDGYEVYFMDTDVDGMPDGWERKNGFSSEDDRDAALDADNDGATNLEEFLASTDPHDPNDKPGGGGGG